VEPRSHLPTGNPPQRIRRGLLPRQWRQRENRAHALTRSASPASPITVGPTAECSTTSRPTSPTRRIAGKLFLSRNTVKTHAIRDLSQAWRLVTLGGDRHRPVDSGSSTSSRCAPPPAGSVAPLHLVTDSTWIAGGSAPPGDYVFPLREGAVDLEHPPRECSQRRAPRERWTTSPADIDAIVKKLDGNQRLSSVLAPRAS